MCLIDINYVKAEAPSLEVISDPFREKDIVLETIINPTEYARNNCDPNLIDKNKIDRAWIGKRIHFSFDPKDATIRSDFYKIPSFSRLDSSDYLIHEYMRQNLEDHSAVIVNAFTESNGEGMWWKFIDEQNGNSVWYRDRLDKINGIRHAYFDDDFIDFRSKYLDKPIWTNNKTELLYISSWETRDKYVRVKNIEKYIIYDLIRNIKFSGQLYPLVLLLKTDNNEICYFPFAVNPVWQMFRDTIKGHLEYSFYFVNPFTDKKWAKKTIEAIKERKVFIGMTKEQVKLSWGRPENINRTISSYGVSEQWIYGALPNAKYLYFENGVLRSIQD
jgi:hypothetical protein